MLIEIFNDTVYDETPCDSSRNIVSRRVPKIIISESGDTKLRDMYLKARDFLTMALDNTYYSIKNGGFYMLEIEVDKTSEITDINSGNMIQKIPERDFTYKFNSLRGTLDTDKNITVHGRIVIDDQLNVVSYCRDRIMGYIEPTSILTPRMVTDSTNISGRRYVYDEIENNGGTSGPFVERCQQNNPPENKSEDADSAATNEESETPVELSENSFSIRKGSINVVHPELEIGVVKGSSFSVDTDKQKRQDEFLKNMSEKISRRNRNLRNPK